MTETKPKDVKTIIKEADEIKCAVQRSIYLINEFLDGPMCGRCLPCPMASYEMRVIFNRMSEGDGTPGDIEAVKRLAPDMQELSMCKKGKDISGFIIDLINSSKSEFESHIEKACPAKECKPLFTYKVIPEKCVSCGDCLEACKDNAIVGEKRVSYRSGYLPFEIADERCTRCDECIKICKYDAIEIVDEKELSEVTA